MKYLKKIHEDFQNSGSKIKLEYDKFKRIIDDIMLEFIDNATVSTYHINHRPVSDRIGAGIDFSIDIHVDHSKDNSDKVLKNIKERFSRRFDFVALAGPILKVDTRYYKKYLNESAEGLNIDRFISLIDDIMLKYMDSGKIENYKAKQAENQMHKIIMMVTYKEGESENTKNTIYKEILSDLERRFNDVHSSTYSFIVNTLNYKKDMGISNIDVPKLISLVDDILVEFVDSGKIADYRIEHPKDKWNNIAIQLTYNNSYKDDLNGYDVLKIRDEIIAKLRLRFEYIEYSMYRIELFINTYKNKKKA